MDFGELSDLEEGEILEYDSYSPVDSSDDFETKNRHIGKCKKDKKHCHLGLRNNKDCNCCCAEQEKNGYFNKYSKEKIDLNKKLMSTKAIDLESISSDWEYVSDSNDKYKEENKNNVSNGEKKVNRQHSSHLYGTVEDIMSEIGEMICRKSHCNYKKRRSKDFVKYSDNSYDLWRDKIFSTHVTGKRRKRKMSDSGSESEFLKVRVEKRKKKKRKREVYYDENETTAKKPKIVDFDEMRRNLLEKLKKQKAEEKLKELTNSSSREVGNSEVQEVEILVESTNYAEDPKAAVRDEPVGAVEESQEKEGEDEMDLIQLRLIALASNRKRKGEVKTEGSEDVGVGVGVGVGVAEDKKSDGSNREEVELDRNELLLRAEALKTALLKKHQKRLNKLKIEKSKAAGSSSDNDVNPRLSSSVQKRAVSRNEEMTASENDSAKDEKEGKSDEEVRLSIENSPLGVSNAQECPTKEAEPTSVSNSVQKKPNQKVRSKRKKRKSCSFSNSLKENSEKSEAQEEDDCTLRSQLLSDLLKKKSLKDFDSKPVLTDSVQASNQIPWLATGATTPKGTRKSLPVVKRNVLRKVNVGKVAKAALAPAPKVPVPEIQRIIVHLGSEDSSDENGGNEDKVPVPQGESEKKETTSVESSSTTESGRKSATEKPNETMQASYEKSVELLLSQARKKIEGKLQSAKTKAKNALATPEAVYKHLPPSQRLEYIRLKQKIAERERLRIQSSNTTSVPSAPETRSNPVNPPPPATVNKNSFGFSKTLSKQSPGPKGANGLIPKAAAPRVLTNRVKTNAVGTSAKGAKKYPAPNSAIGSSSLLLPSSQALISKLKLLLKKIKIEKTIEENYEKEISKLKSQLNLFERKKTEQRFKIKKLGEESMKTYKAIQGITARANEKVSTKAEEKGKEKTVEEKKEEKEEEKKEEEKQEEKKEEETKEKEEKEEGKKVPNDEPETDISKADSKIDKEPNSDGDNGGRTSETVSTEETFVVGLLEYISPLEVFKKAGGSVERVDPNVTMCHFDLMGVCKDEECTYQHLRTS